MIDTKFSNTQLTKAIIRSQHCQRNWDLSQSIPQEDLQVLVDSVTQCPSKQNVAYYKAHFITNRDLIQQVYDQTDGFTVTYQPYTTTKNTQVLANLLVVLEATDYENSLKVSTVPANGEAHQLRMDKELSEESANILAHDQKVAVGVAAGYLNLSAALMEYATGCCSCFSPDGVQSVLGLKNKPLLLMGIGFNQQGTNRRVHQEDENFIFPIKKKQPIEVNFID